MFRIKYEYKGRVTTLPVKTKATARVLYELQTAGANIVSVTERR